jgi:NAD-reducing hydrogenase large subunit
MAERIVIDPVTRIEGHAKITLHLDDNGRVRDARFHVAEFRGFERFCVGRPFTEMAGITSRVCGICPVSHLIASVKAGDQIMAVEIPPAAEKLRRLLNLAQIVQSHALSFFYLSSPDLVLGFDSPPEKRSIFALAQANPDLARGGIRLRAFGQKIIAALGGQRIHPSWTTPGGVRSALTPEHRDEIRRLAPEARATTQNALQLFKSLLDQYREEVETFGNFPTLFLGLVASESPDPAPLVAGSSALQSGTWEHYGGRIRVTDPDGAIVADGLDPAHYQRFIGEAVESDSYLKSPYYLPHGYPDGIYRVGPLARLNLCRQMGTPLADRELAEFRQRSGSRHSSFLYHHARLIEILTAVERIEQLSDDPDVLSEHHRARAGVNRQEGVGCSEAPRGTLFHHYQVDEHGLLTKVNLIVATGQNNLAMNRTVAQIARHYIQGPTIPEALLNRVEAGIRAFDPCLSCSTHAFGSMPLLLRLIGPDGTLLDEVRR